MLKVLINLLLFALISVLPYAANAQSMDRRSPTFLDVPMIRGYAENTEKKYYYVTKPIEGKWTFSGFVKAHEDAPVKYVGLRVKCSQQDGQPLGGMLHVHGSQDYKEYSILVPKKQPVIIEVAPQGAGEYEVKFWPAESL